MLKFVGDINLTDWDFNFGFGIGSRIAHGFDPFSHLERKEGDVWIGNFEGVTSDVSNKKGMAAQVFRVSPAALKNVHHFDIYGFANNHAMQHGVEAYLQTWEVLQKQGSKVFGKDDCRSICFEHQGKQVSLTGCCLRIDQFTNNPCYWYNPEYKDMEKEIEGLPKDSFKVLFIHWGNEYINRPSSQQKKLAHWLIDAGYDLIIGMHPHVLQGYEDYKGKRIYYSLGNFVFDMPSLPCKTGVIVGVDLSGSKPVYTNEYIRIDGTCSPAPVGKEAIQENLRFEYLNEVLKKEDNSESYYKEIRARHKQYHKENRKTILENSLSHPKVFFELIIDFVRRRIL